MRSDRKPNRSSFSNIDRDGFTDEDVMPNQPITSPGGSTPPRGLVAYADARPSLFKRLMAECGDRIIAVFGFAPIIALPIVLIGKEYFVPMWLFIDCAWHLLRDASPDQRSLFKKYFRLRVVRTNGQDKCSAWRLVLRRSGSAISQLFYALALAMLSPSWDIRQSAIAAAQRIFGLFGSDCPKPSSLMISALIYDIVSLIAILISPAGQRIEDLFMGTRVIPERAFLEDRKHCTVCRRLMSKHASHCPHCGALNFIKPIIRRKPNN